MQRGKELRSGSPWLTKDSSRGTMIRAMPKRGGYDGIPGPFCKHAACLTTGTIRAMPAKGAVEQGVGACRNFASRCHENLNRFQRILWKRLDREAGGAGWARRGRGGPARFRPARAAVPAATAPRKAGAWLTGACGAWGKASTEANPGPLPGATAGCGGPFSTPRPAAPGPPKGLVLAAWKLPI